MKNTGVYKILNLINGNHYIGSTSDFKRREKQHFNELAKGKHHNYKLQEEFNSFGFNSFRFSVIENCHVPQLQSREQFYLNTTQPHYNISLDVKRIPEHAKKRKSKGPKKKVYVLQYKHGELIKRHKSAAAAASFIKGKKEEIAKSCRQLLTIYKGYNWGYDVNFI